MSKYLIGVDLGGTNTKAAIYTTQFETVTELSAATKAAKGPAYVLSISQKRCKNCSLP